MDKYLFLMNNECHDSNLEITGFFTEMSGKRQHILNFEKSLNKLLLVGQQKHIFFSLCVKHIFSCSVSYARR